MHLEEMGTCQPADIVFVDGALRVVVCNSMRAAMDNMPYEPSTDTLSFRAWLSRWSERLWVVVEEESRRSWIDGRAESVSRTDRLFVSSDCGQTWSDLEWWKRSLPGFIPPADWPVSLDVLTPLKAQ